MAAKVKLRRGAIVLYGNGAIVNRAGCPEHEVGGRGACSCFMIVALSYADDRMSQVIFDAVAEEVLQRRDGGR
jgi:hypothetical protein